MDIGMLWFDNDQKSSIPSKVERAARYYQKKYGKNPDLCYVHPKMVKGANGGKKKEKNAFLETIRGLTNIFVNPERDFSRI